MFDSRNGWLRDPLLRIAGLVLLGCGWLLMRWLFHAPGLRQHQDPTFIEFTTAALGFLCFSAGGALTTLGAHMFDQVEISERWARRPYSPSNDKREPSSPAFTVVPERDFIPALARRAPDQAAARHAPRPAEAGGGNARP